METRVPQWFAVVTKPRQEQIAVENLQRQGYECYLPMAENPYQRRTADQRIVEPLFPRYLFICADAHHQTLAPVRSTRGVVSLVRFGVELAVVPESVIKALRSRMHEETGLIQIDPIPVEQGDTVKVFDGPLAGVSGIVKEKKGENRALLLMELMGRVTTVEVDALLLQRAG